MRPDVLVLVTLTGCAAPRQTVIANREAPAPLECTTDAVERVSDTLKARWDIPTLQLRCTAGQFQSAGFFIEAIVERQRYTGIVDASGTELVAFVEEPTTDPYSFITSYRVADLDGDGEDEIIESWRRTPTYALVPDNWLVVRMVSGKRLLRIKGPYLSRYHPELGSCSGTWQLRSRSIDVAVSVGPGIPPSDCLPAGKHRFELRGHALVDARRN